MDASAEAERSLVQARVSGRGGGARKEVLHRRALPTGRLLLLTAVPVLAFASCGEDDAAGLAVEDGRLVEELRIDGHAEGLVPIGQLVVRADGVVAVAQPQDFQVRFFDADGQFMGAFGREGEGPGEFRSIWRIGWDGDVLWAYDQSQLRLTFVSPPDELVRTTTVPGRVSEVPAEVGELPPFLRPVPWLLDSEEDMLAGFAIAAGMPLPDAFSRPAVGRVTTEGAVRWVVTVPFGEPSFVALPGRVVGVPFRNVGAITVSPAGDRIAGVSTSLEGDYATAFDVTIWNSTGGVVWQRSYPFEARVIPRAVADSAIADRVEDLNSELRQAYRDEISVPPVYPPVEGIQFGRDGTIWVEKSVRDGRRPYIVLHSDGEPAGRVVVPSDTRIVAVENGQVWGIQRDEVDVESIVRYRVEWGT